MMPNKKESADYMELIKRKKSMIGFDYENEKECLATVKQRGFALEYVKEQTPEICLEAVKRNGLALEYVNEQTPEICLAAVKQCGLVLQYVKEQTPEICIAAMKNSHYCIIYVDDLHFLLDDNGNSLLNYPDED